MNIQELAEKAGMTRHPADRRCRAPYWDVVIDPELEHFAALVLEEAAKVCDDEALAHRLAFLNREAKQAATAKNCADGIRALKGAKE